MITLEKSKEDIKLDVNIEESYEGQGNYFKVALAKYVENWAKKNEIDIDLYRDGLIIHTTLDSRMQTYAEEAMDEHLVRLQKEFDAQNVKNKTAPFRDITPEETQQILNSAMRRSDRWRELAKQGKEKEEII